MNWIQRLFRRKPRGNTYSAVCVGGSENIVRVLTALRNGSQVRIHRYPSKIHRETILEGYIRSGLSVGGIPHKYVSCESGDFSRSIHKMEFNHSDLEFDSDNPSTIWWHEQ